MPRPLKYLNTIEAARVPGYSRAKTERMCREGRILQFN
jgi:hypothetical protein